MSNIPHYELNSRIFDLKVLALLFVACMLRANTYQFLCEFFGKQLLPCRYVCIFGDRVRTGQYFSTVSIVHGVDCQADQFNSH